jgi:hypothetical protein
MANDFPVGGQALVRAEVSAPRDEARDHPLTIDHYIFDALVEIGKCDARALNDSSDVFEAEPV